MSADEEWRPIPGWNRGLPFDPSEADAEFARIIQGEAA